MSKSRNVLITSAGRRVELVESFKRAVQDLGLNSKVFCTDLKPGYSSACQVADASWSLPRVTKPEYIDSLINLCIQNDIELVVPTIDTELLVLAENRERFSKTGIKVVISDYELVEKCRDKVKTEEIFDRLGIVYPKRYPVNELEFPCFCKPKDGSRSVGAKAILTEDELDKKDTGNPNNIFMEYIGSDYCEYTVDLYYDLKSELICLVPRERIEVRDGEVSKGVTRKNRVFEVLSTKMAYLKGAKGCITAQFFVHKESLSIKGLEINPRFGGGYPLSDAAGADFCRWMLEEYLLQKKMKPFNNWKSNLLMLRYDAQVILDESMG